MAESALLSLRDGAWEGALWQWCVESSDALGSLSSWSTRSSSADPTTEFSNEARLLHLEYQKKLDELLSEELTKRGINVGDVLESIQDSQAGRGGGDSDSAGQGLVKFVEAQADFDVFAMMMLEAAEERRALGRRDDGGDGDGGGGGGGDRPGRLGELGKEDEASRGGRGDDVGARRWEGK